MSRKKHTIVVAPSRDIYDHNTDDLFCLGGGSGWQSCRDSLLDNFIHYSSSKLFYQCSNLHVLTRVKNLLNDIQKVAKIPVECRCKVYHTTDDHIICIKLNKFWKSKIRFSLLTALVRTARYYYNNKSINIALGLSNNSYHYYSKGSMYAVKRFIDGHWRINYQPNNGYYLDHRFDGWLDYFSDMADHDIDHVLI